VAISRDDRTNISTNNRTSRYTQGGFTDKYSKRIGWWERIIFEPRDDDILYEIQTYQARRPDLVAKAVYGQVRLTWLVLQYNSIVDVETEFLAGKEIRLPTQRRVITEITTRPVGGSVVK
jgi:hypothetical protein